MEHFNTCFDTEGINSYLTTTDPMSFLFYASCFHCTFFPSRLRFVRSYVVVACSLFIREIPLAIKLIFCRCVHVCTQLIQINMTLPNKRQRNEGCLAPYQYILNVIRIKKNPTAESVMEHGGGLSEKGNSLFFVLLSIDGTEWRESCQNRPFKNFRHEASLASRTRLTRRTICRSACHEGLQ